MAIISYRKQLWQSVAVCASFAAPCQALANSPQIQDLPANNTRAPRTLTRYQENFFRGETEADRLYREGIKARFDLEPEKARALFMQATKAKGSIRAQIKAGIYLKCYMPKDKVSPECQALYKQADRLVQENKLAEGLAAFQDLEKKYPKFEWIQIGLAAIHLKREDPERAAICARRALQINPDYVDAWLILTHDCLMHHDMEGARDTAQKAHLLDPYSDTVGKVLASINVEFGKVQAD